MENEKILHAFDGYLQREKRSSENTRLSYLRDVRQFFAYYQLSVADVDREHIQAFMTQQKQNGRSASTIARNLASLKTFFAFCLDEGFVSDNPATGISAERTAPTTPQVLTFEEVDLLLDQPRCIDLKGYRDKAMLELLYATGIRVSELVSLTIDDVNLKENTINCRREDRDRVIPISSKAAKAVGEYMGFIRKQMVRDLSEKCLFVNVNGSPMTRQGFWKILKTYQKKAGIEKNITPHVLRHSFAAHSLSKGSDMKSVQKIMGHSDVSTTGMYACFVSEQGKRKK